MTRKRQVIASGKPPNWAEKPFTTEAVLERALPVRERRQVLFCRALAGVPERSWLALLFRWGTFVDSIAQLIEVSKDPVAKVQFFVVIDGRRLGPLDSTALQSLPIQPVSWVWRDGFSDWQRAEDVPEVRELLASLPPPLPPTGVVAAPTDAIEKLKGDFRRAIPFVVAALLCYFATAPVLAALTGFGTVGKVASFLVAELPVRLCGAAMAFYFARGLGLPLPIAWSVPSLLHPVFTLITGPALAYLAQKRLKQAGVSMGFFGPLA